MSERQCYDLIGDIHGHYDKLTTLLDRLGYTCVGKEPSEHSFEHPEGRKVIFLGDYIDRGPKVREVLLTVRAMVESGNALAVLGNHEHVAFLYHEPDGKGSWLRPPWLRHGMGLAKTISQFEGREEEWQDWLTWLKTLPLYLDLGDLRAVHACWNAEAIEFLGDRCLSHDPLLHSTADRSTSDHWAVEQLLTGPEMTIPDGAMILNARGMPLPYTRVRWWDIPTGPVDLADLALPEPLDDRGEADREKVRQLPNYPPDGPPVFFGHYWLSPDKDKTPLRHNIACLDYSAAKNGPLVAYRWNGEAALTSAHFITS